MNPESAGKVTLAVDIGGSEIKALRLDRRGCPLGASTKRHTPRVSHPAAVLELIVDMARGIGAFDRMSVGFPGVVETGVVRGAVNLADGWTGFPLQELLAKELARPVRVANDADVQGLGSVEGVGVELVLTLGTGLGSALFLDGKLLPNMELGHLPYHENRSFEQEVSNRTLAQIRSDVWRERILEVIKTFRRTINFRHLYLGGGNARLLVHVSGFELPDWVTCIRNDAGLTGGIALWEGIPEGRPVPLLP